MNYPEGTVSGLPNCGIVACAYAANVSYQTAWDWFKNHNNRRASWKGRTWHSDYGLFLKRHGIKFKEIEYDKIPLRKWCQDKKGKWLVHVTGHSLIFQDGKFLDQHQSRVSIDDYFYKNSRVDIAWKIKNTL